MDGARLSRFPHLAWLGYGFEAPADARTHCWSLNGHAHALHISFRGRHRVRWISQGREVDYRMQAGTFHFLPADDEPHTIVARAADPMHSFTLFVPRRHLADMAATEHVDGGGELHRLLVHDDPVLQACMRRLAVPRSAADADATPTDDEATRRLVLRLIEASGGGTPDWSGDDSTFTTRTLAQLVAHIDAHLRISPALGDMALLVGLSPSHFAKKFRHSTGLSLQRFVNRRRIRRSLETLKDPSLPLADASLDLGFSSQSHFTRLFSQLTSMTPAKYQRQFRPTVG